MGFLCPSYNVMPESNISANAKRKKMGDKFAFLSRAKIRRAQDPANKRYNNYDPLIEVEEEGDDGLGDVPRCISTHDDRLLLPLLSRSTPSLDSLGSPVEMMRKNLTMQCGDVYDEEETVARIQSIMQHQTPLVEYNQGEVSDDGLLGIISPCESMGKKPIPRSRASVNYDERAVAKLQSIMQQAPSLDQLSKYIAALSPAVSPDPSAGLSSRALRCLLSLSEQSSHMQQRIAMVRDAGDDNCINVSLVPALLAFLKRCPRNSPVQHLTLLILNNLSIPTENKRPIALEHRGAKILGRLLNKDPDCQMLVIIILNLTFGDERYPLVDPEDPITCRMVARVVSFLGIWKKKGLPLDFRRLYGVNTGLCTMDYHEVSHPLS